MLCIKSMIFVQKTSVQVITCNTLHQIHDFCTENICTSGHLQWSASKAWFLYRKHLYKWSPAMLCIKSMIFVQTTPVQVVICNSLFQKHDFCSDNTCTSGHRQFCNSMYQKYDFCTNYTCTSGHLQCSVLKAWFFVQINTCTSGHMHCNVLTKKYWYFFSFPHNNMLWVYSLEAPLWSAFIEYPHFYFCAAIWKLFTWHPALICSCEYAKIKDSVRWYYSSKIIPVNTNIPQL